MIDRLPPRARTPVIVGGAVLKDSLAGVRRARADLSNTSGTERSHEDPSVDVQYALGAFAGLRSRGDLDDIEGKQALELGPGDTQALGLCFIAAGAQRVVGVDRFDVVHDTARQRTIYRQLRDALEPEQQARVDAVLRDGDPPLDPERLPLAAGIPVEELDRAVAPGSVDLIYSVAVCEHLTDLETAFAAMDRALTPGGQMLHQVDLRDHGAFSRRGLDPLTWLTVPEPLYRRMVRHRAGPNRQLASAYHAIMRKLGYDYVITVAKVAGEDADLNPYPERLVAGEHFGDEHREMVRRIRPRLVPQFRELPDEDLLTASIFLAAHKPSA